MAKKAKREIKKKVISISIDKTKVASILKLAEKQNRSMSSMTNVLVDAGLKCYKDVL